MNILENAMKRDTKNHLSVWSFNILLSLCVSLCSDAIGKTPFKEDLFIYYDKHAIAKTKLELSANRAGKDRKNAFDSLIDDANKALGQANESVTYKTMLPPSKNKNDYMSISRYWWPNKTSKSGLPWIRKDGKTNPDTQSDHVDRARLARLSFAIRNLGLAYYFTEEEKYAKKAVEMVLVWFLNEDTYMKPNLNFAQSVPGQKPRKSGILDGRDIPVEILDSVTMIKQSKHWNRSLDKHFNEWLKAYLKWLTNSRLGKQATKSTNNHGSWYHFHVAAVAFYIGDFETAKKFIKSAEKLVSTQIDTEGKQKHELERTRSYYYSIFNLDALTRIAIIANKLDIDFWRYETKDGVGIIKALDYMATYADGSVEWPYPHQGQQLLYLPQLFIRATNTLKNDRYKNALSVNFKKPSAFGKTTKNVKAYRQERFLFNTNY